MLSSSQYLRKMHLKAYPSTEAPKSERRSFNGDHAEWTPDDINKLSRDIREKRIRCPPLMYEHGKTQRDKIGEVKGVYYNEIDKWMHAKCIFDCPKRAAQVQNGQLRGVSLCFAKRLDTDHKRALEISLTKDPDFQGAEVTVIRSHSSEHPDQYFIPLSAGPKAISKLMSAIDETPQQAAMADDAPVETPSSSVPENAAESALVEQLAPTKQAQPEPFTAEKLRAMEEQVPLEERAAAMNKLIQEKNALEQEKRAREEHEAKTAEEARQAEIAKKREALKPTVDRVLSLTNKNAPEEQKREIVDNLVPALESNPMLHALLERNFKTEDALSGQLKELQEQAKVAQEEREKSERLALALQDQLAETRHLIETLDASRQAGLNLSAREIIKSHSKKNPNMSNSIYDQWFGASAPTPSTSSSSSHSSSSASFSSFGAPMASMAKLQEQAEMEMPTNKLIETAKSLFSVNGNETVKCHSRGSKRDAVEEPELVTYLRGEGVLGGARAEQKRQKRIQKYGSEQIISSDPEEMVMRHSRKRMNYVEARREQRQNSDALPPITESRAVVYRQLRDAIKEVSEHSIKGDQIVTNSLLGTDTNGFIQLLDECYTQRRTNIPCNSNPGTTGTLDLPVLGLKDLDALPQHERKKYPEAFFNPTWRAENARRRDEFNRAQGFTIY